MPDPRHELGQSGERAAEKLLRGRGLKTLARRFSTPAGELDLVMQDGQTIVFVEVKTQRDAIWQDPEQRVDATKQRRLIRAAKWYVVANHLEERPLRFDVVTVIQAPPAADRIEHFADAFAPRRW